MKKIKNHVSSNIGSKLREARRSAGISAATLAKKLGLSQQQISRYECGKTSMTIDTVVKIAHELNISVSKLLCDYEQTSKYEDSINQFIY